MANRAHNSKEDAFSKKRAEEKEADILGRERDHVSEKPRSAVQDFVDMIRKL